MVHTKYIKRGNRVFGPYYYESYREGGVTKKRYVKPEEAKLLGLTEKQIKFSFGNLAFRKTFSFVFILLIFLGAMFFFAYSSYIR